MSRGKRLLILCLVLVLSVASFAVVYQVQKNKPEESSSESESDSVYEGYGNLFDYEAKDIQTIRIQNDLDDFTLESTVTEKESEASDDESSSEPTYTIHWDIQGHADWILDGDSVDNTVELASSLFANRMADEDASTRNLADFGLDDPCSTITISYYDGTSQTIYVGDQTTDGSFCYGMIEGDDAIYTLGRNARKTSEFTAEGLRYLSSLAINEEGEIWYLLIENADGRNTEISYAGLDDKGDTLAYYNSGVWKYACGEGYAYPELMFAAGDLDETYKTVPEVTLDQQIEDDCQDLDQYGLGDTPVHHVVLKYRVEVNEEEVAQAEEAGSPIDTSDAVYDEDTGKSYWYTTLEYNFGNEYTDEDGQEMVYFRYADSNDVFGVSKSIVDQFRFDPFPYVQKTIYLNALDNVESMKLVTQDEEYDISVKRGEVTVDEDGNEEQPVVYRINDQLVETEAFKDLYQALIGVMADYEIYDEEPDYDKSDMLRIEYTFTDGSTHAVTYYRLNDFYYVTQVADDAWFACKYTQMSDIWNLMEVCLNSEAE